MPRTSVKKEAGTEEDLKCYFISQFELISRKWSLFIIAHLYLEGEMTFSEMKKKLVGCHGERISNKMLADRLKELEDEGIITRKVKSGRPVRVIYKLTEKGVDFKDVLIEFSRWNKRWTKEDKDAMLSKHCEHCALKILIETFG